MIDWIKQILKDKKRRLKWGAGILIFILINSYIAITSPMDFLGFLMAAVLMAVVSNTPR